MNIKKYRLSVEPGDTAEMVEDEDGGYYDADDIDPILNFILDKKNCGRFCASGGHSCPDCFPNGKHFRPEWEERS